MLIIFDTAGRTQIDLSMMNVKLKKLNLWQIQQRQFWLQILLLDK